MSAKLSHFLSHLVLRQLLFSISFNMLELSRPNTNIDTLESLEMNLKKRKSYFSMAECIIFRPLRSGAASSKDPCQHRHRHRSYSSQSFKKNLKLFGLFKGLCAFPVSRVPLGSLGSLDP